MKAVSAILSLLHEPPTGSATRLFRGKPVLHWTLQRLGRCNELAGIDLLCWDDQLAAVAPVAGAAGAMVSSKGTRRPVPELDAVTAAQRWADGWRGGLLATCHFDLGFHAEWHHEASRQTGSDAVVLVDPSAALVDPELIDALIVHARAHDAVELCFSPAAPGFGAALLHTALLNRLAAARTHAGRLMHYHPDQTSREPLAGEGCAPVPTPVLRTQHRFTLDSDRLVQRIEAATQSLNGQLATSTAEELVRRLDSHRTPDRLPREIVLELNTTRASRPIFWPGNSLPISRPEFALDDAKRLLDEISTMDDVRLTLAGVGDPLLAAQLPAILKLAKQHSCLTVNLETDLLGVTPDRIDELAASGVSVISVHLPALTQKTYAAVMGCDGYVAAIENLRKLLIRRQAAGTGLPLLAPIFTKCQPNLAEMEAWYDQWLRACGSAVVRGPSNFAGQIPATAVADMAPSARRPCARITSRLTVLSDGRVVSCEEDVRGLHPMGRIGEQPLSEIWVKRFERLRENHRSGEWNRHPLCGACREWHRP